VWTGLVVQLDRAGCPAGTDRPTRLVTTPLAVGDSLPIPASRLRRFCRPAGTVVFIGDLVRTPEGRGLFSAVPRGRKIRGRKPIAQRFHRWGSWPQSEHRVPVGTKELSLPQCVATNGRPGLRGSRGRLGGRPSPGPSRRCCFRYRLFSILAVLDAGCSRHGPLSLPAVGLNGLGERINSW
jgi:hypothetical protein